MAENDQGYAGPPVNMETWIEKGRPGHWLTGKGATGDSFHLEINSDPVQEEGWVREYAAGRTEFRDKHIAAARGFLAEDMPAEAVIESRIALEIPWQGRHFMFNQGVVAKAMDYEYDFWAETKSYDDLGKDLRTLTRAMSEAFDTPHETKLELENIASAGRSAIRDKEISAWHSAVTHFDQNGELHATALGLNELGNAHEDAGQPQEAIFAQTRASELLRFCLDSVMTNEAEAFHAAEVNELASQLHTTLRATVLLYAAQDKVFGDNKERLKKTVYELDDLTMDNIGYSHEEVILEGYKLLRDSSRFKERRFFKKEAASVAGQLVLAKGVEDNPGGVVSAIVPLRNPRHRRPPVMLQQ